jgi:drug/metabolite transporter (DMT)-like permease
MSRASTATLALVGATIAVSFSAIFIRVAGDDPATVVWLRMSLAVALLAPFAVRDARRGVVARSRRDAGLVLAGGVLLAGHFLLWTASLAFTSVAASVLLVSLHPVIVAPLGLRLLGERPRIRTYLGMALALAGTVLTCAGDVRVDSRALSGDLLAIGGAVCLAGYLLIGRGARRSLGVAGYSVMVYATVALVAAATAVAFHVVHVPSPRVALLGLALAVVCTVGGHTVYNWALRHVHAVTVSVSFLGEPPLAALLALAFLASIPSPSTIGGGVLILAGLALALTDLRPQVPPDVLIALE